MIDADKLQAYVDEDPCVFTISDGGSVIAVWTPDDLTPKTYVEISTDEMSVYDVEELESVLVEMGYTQLMPTRLEVNRDE